MSIQIEEKEEGEGKKGRRLLFVVRAVGVENNNSVEWWGGVSHPVYIALVAYQTFYMRCHILPRMCRSTQPVAHWMEDLRGAGEAVG